ncbi:MAG: leucyl aminopeptidase, partial [Proteobacteria bacterium]|nr:leucyl aminopeptidase [Pseudomonadota bacterium]
MKIDFVAADAPAGAAGALAVLAFEDGLMSPPAEALDKALGGLLRRAVAGSRFKGSMGQTLDIVAPVGLDAARLVLVGAGKKSAWDDRAAELSAAHAYNAVKT